MVSSYRTTFEAGYDQVGYRVAQPRIVAPHPPPITPIRKPAVQKSEDLTASTAYQAIMAPRNTTAYLYIFLFSVGGSYWHVLA